MPGAQRDDPAGEWDEGLEAIEAPEDEEGSEPPVRSPVAEPRPLATTPQRVEPPPRSGPVPEPEPPTGAASPEPRPATPPERPPEPVIAREPSQPTAPAEATFEPPPPPPSPSRTRRQCDVIICFAGKGGVGKTTLSLALSQRAHVVGGLNKVAAIDANRGQGDMRRVLRVTRSNLPSIYDAAMTGDPKKALVTAEELAKARHPNRPKLGIAVILAPDDAQADPHRVDAAAYRDAISEARSVGDLVIIDTQIIEAKDLSGLVNHLVIPLLRSGAWGLGITDSSIAGADNLLRRLRDFEAAGVPRDRLLVAMNRKAGQSEIRVEELSDLVSRYLSAYVGTISEQPEIYKAFEQGTLPHDAPELANVLDSVLWRVTGLSACQRSSGDAKPRKTSFLSRFFKRK